MNRNLHVDKSMHTFAEIILTLCNCQHSQVRSHFIWILFKSPGCFKASSLLVKSWHRGMDWFKTLSWLNHFSLHRWDKNICLTALCCRSTAVEKLRELQRGRHLGESKRVLSAAASKRRHVRKDYRHARTMKEPGPAWPVSQYNISSVTSNKSKRTGVNHDIPTKIIWEEERVKDEDAHVREAVKVCRSWFDRPTWIQSAVSVFLMDVPQASSNHSVCLFFTVKCNR